MPASPIRDLIASLATSDVAGVSKVTCHLRVMIDIEKPLSKFDMVWLYPGGEEGVLYSFKLFLPAFAALIGGGGAAPCACHAPRFSVLQMVFPAAERVWSVTSRIPGCGRGLPISNFNSVCILYRQQFRAKLQKRERVNVVFKLYELVKCILPAASIYLIHFRWEEILISDHTEAAIVQDPWEFSLICTCHLLFPFLSYIPPPPSPPPFYLPFLVAPSLSPCPFPVPPTLRAPITFLLPTSCPLPYSLFHLPCPYLLSFPFPISLPYFSSPVLKLEGQSHEMDKK